MNLKESLQENSQIDLAWLSTESRDLKESLIYFEGLQEREAYRTNANRQVTADIINTLKQNLNIIQVEYGRRIKNKELK